MTDPFDALGWSKHDDPQSKVVQDKRGPFPVQVSDDLTVRVVSREEADALEAFLAAAAKPARRTSKAVAEPEGHPASS